MGGPHKVGIVVVSYNAPTAVRVTLASVRAARNDVAHELVLVDNASRPDDREEIRRALHRHVQEAGLPWRHLQSDKNLGFSGGNNVGIRALLEDPAITHLCLLNSDVIVPHRWLDQLLASGLDVVSPVTNKAMSEQCVPIDYTFELADCLDPAGERLRDDVFATIDAFAVRRHRVFGGHRVDCDATFFCVLLSRAAVERIGLLDETFFPGGFEDDDYCARARALGFPVFLDRGVFVHHWGSASFGQLDPGYFNENAARNRAWLEKKHGFTWQARPEKPLVAFAQDMEFALRTPRDAEATLAFCSLYGRELGKLLAHYRREFDNLRKASARSAVPPPADLAAAAAAAGRHGDLEATWRRLFGAVRTRLRRPDVATIDHEQLLGQLQALAGAVHEVVVSTFALHGFLTAQADPGAPPAPPVTRSWWRRTWSLLRHGVPFVWRLRGIVFFGGYPYAARENDGYFQRIRAIDRLFEDRWRIYYDPSPLPSQTAWYDLPAPRTLVLRPLAGRWRNRFVAAVVGLLVLRCRAVWFHSVLRMEDMGFARFLRWPFVRKVLDVHGVVPEEFRMHDDFFSAVLFDRHEQLAVRKTHALVVVTEAMRRYFAQKYRDLGRAEVLVLPIFPAIPCHRDDKPLVDGRPVVVYAGGLHRWQQVPKMIDAMLRTANLCLHRFYCTDPEAVLRLLPEAVIDDGTVVVDRKSHDELLECYRECHYGFLLRADSVVNRVACPTKVVEYLAMGIVPILDCEQVGDFAELGMRFVRLEDFVAGRLPDAATRDAMARDNFTVHGRLQAQREAGAARVRQLFGPGPAPGSAISRGLWHVAKLLPPSTWRGRLARRVWYGLKGQPAPARPPVADQPDDVPPCDVLVQVGHFLAGGLENVVLDLNDALRAAGLRVNLLVLGEQGPAVARAKAQGVPVLAGSYSEANYRRWLQASAPKVVMSHYSVEGAALCAAAGVPLVQVIHNIYLWLHGAELQAMRASAAHTTTFVATSRFVRDYSIRRLGFPAEKCVVIPCGIDVGRFRDPALAADRDRLRAELGIPPDAFVFLNVGALNHQKNHLGQVRAFAACAAACPRARLVVVGPIYEQELFRDCKDLVERHGLTGRVIFTGAVGDPHRYYAMADALVHSAFFEGGPLALLEGLAANLPVVTVATGLAVHFTGQKGVTTVTPHFDVAGFQGHITEMKSSPATEHEMAMAMQRVYQAPERPDLPTGIVDAFDRANAYRVYVELVKSLVDARTERRAMITKPWSEQLDATA